MTFLDDNPKTKVGPGCCCLVHIRSDCGRKLTVYVPTLIWNLFSNTPVYFNALNNMFKRLGLSSDRLSDLKSPGETAGLAITAVLLSGYAIGNQRKYGHDALAAIFPDYKTDKPSSHGIWKASDVLNAIVKTGTNTISTLLITKPYLGWIPGGAITAFSSWANYEANAAYYLRETRSISASCSPTVKKGIRYTVTTVFSLSSALLYVLALADVRGHLNGSDKSCFDTPDTLDAVTIAGCAISLLTISLATFDRYNTDMARRLDEESCNLPKLLDVLCKAKAIAIFAALCKTVISAFSAYELFNAYNSPLALTLSLIALSALANIMVQYGIFGQPDQLSTVDIPLLGEQEQNPTPRPSSAGSQKSDDPGPLPTAFAPSHRSHRGNWCARFFSWCCSSSEETPDKARQAKHLSLA